MNQRLLPPQHTTTTIPPKNNTQNNLKKAFRQAPVLHPQPLLGPHLQEGRRGLPALLRAPADHPTPGRLIDGPYTSYDLNTLLKATTDEARKGVSVAAGGHARRADVEARRRGGRRPEPGACVHGGEGAVPGDDGGWRPRAEQGEVGGAAVQVEREGEKRVLFSSLFFFPLSLGSLSFSSFLPSVSSS